MGIMTECGHGLPIDERIEACNNTLGNVSGNLYALAYGVANGEVLNINTDILLRAINLNADTVEAVVELLDAIQLEIHKKALQTAEA